MYNGNYYGTPKQKINEYLDKVISILKAEKCRTDIIEEVLLNNTEEEIHESLIDNKDFLN